MEEWRDVVGYEGLYQISNEGRVKSMQREQEKMLNAWDRRGYPTCCLYKDGKESFVFVHRLVANAFVPNPEGYPMVNHKDENPSNCFADNLEWCDLIYNCNYGTRNERIGKALSKKVGRFSKEGVLVEVYDSMHDAERKGFQASKVCLCCNGKRKYHKGFEWRFI